MMKEGGELRSFLGSAIVIIGFAGIAAVGNFPDMVPASGTPAATSLTVERAASGHLTLLVMLILALIFVPDRAPLHGPRLQDVLGQDEGGRRRLLTTGELNHTSSAVKGAAGRMARRPFSLTISHICKQVRTLP